MNANEAWIAVIRRIPTLLHDALALGLTTGSEIVVQKIVRLDPEFMMIRGRLAGTQDTGRVVLVPYVQLTFIAIQRDLKDAEIEAIFGQGGRAAMLTEMPSVPAATEAPTEPTPEEPEPSEEPKPAKKPDTPSRSVLLAKLRERLKEPGK